jgi:hypothetical protein
VACGLFGRPFERPFWHTRRDVEITVAQLLLCHKWRCRPRRAPAFIWFNRCRPG